MWGWTDLLHSSVSLIPWGIVPLWLMLEIIEHNFCKAIHSSSQRWANQTNRSYTGKKQQKPNLSWDLLNTGLQKTACSTQTCLEDICLLCTAQILLPYTEEFHRSPLSSSLLTSDFYSQTKWVNHRYQLKLMHLSVPIFWVHTGHQTMQKPCLVSAQTWTEHTESLSGKPLYVPNNLLTELW